MTRRTLTLSAAGALLVLLFGAASLRPVPYVTMRPGPVHDTLGSVDGREIVSIEGRREYPTRGRLDLTTVSVTSPAANLSLGSAIEAWLDPDEAVLPRDVVYPPSQTPEQAEEQSGVEMTSSQDAAKVAALTELGYDVGYDVTVAQVLDGAPARGHLRAGDVIVAVGGSDVERPAEVGELLQRFEPGERVSVTVRRQGTTSQVRTPTEAAPDDPGRTIVGIQIVDEPLLPFEVDINLGHRIGGPSAGLMFSLAIIDKLTPGALTGGRHVAGTGEVSTEGRVGPIGGIQQKVAAAAETGAEAFLVPARNCAEAVRAGRAEDLRLVRVASLSEARDAVQTLAEDPAVTVPVCS